MLQWNLEREEREEGILNLGVVYLLDLYSHLVHEFQSEIA